MLCQTKVWTPVKIFIWNTIVQLLSGYKRINPPKPSYILATFSGLGVAKRLAMTIYLEFMDTHRGHRVTQS